LCALVAVPVGAVPDAKGAVTAAAPDLSADAAMTARLNYNLGYEQFEKTQLVEKQAATLTGSKAKAAQKNVLDGYRAARARFEVAVKADPDLKEGWNLVGYTSRRLGEFDQSLAAYEKALALNPTYAEAIEYRAEAYLALHRLEDVKTAYLALFASSPAHAKVLMESMRSWVAENRKHPSIAAVEVEAFGKWVEERNALALQTASLRGAQATVSDWR
jgi:tetratricopeptide (TPR) repeat protein